MSAFELLLRAWGVTLKHIPGGIGDMGRALESAADSLAGAKNAALDYIDTLLGVPSKTDTEAKFKKDAAAAKVSEFRGTLRTVPDGVSTVMRVDKVAATSSVAEYRGTLRAVPDGVGTTMRVDKVAATSSVAQYRQSISFIPAGVFTQASFSVAAAIGNIRTLNYQLDRINGRTVSAYVRVETSGNVAALRGIPTRRASGGIIPGPPSTLDTVPALLSSGEFVVNAASTSRYRTELEAMNRNRFATGGFVTTTRRSFSGSGATFNLNVYGPIGSQSQLEDWLQVAVGNLQRKGRI
jgi:hypothetical protein